MAVTHTTAVRDSIADLVVDNLDAGVLRYLTSGDATVADGVFGTPAFGASTGGTATANAIGDAQNTTGGSLTTTKAAMRSTTLDIVLCSVTGPGGGGDIIISNPVIADQETIVTNSLTYTACP